MSSSIEVVEKPTRIIFKPNSMQLSGMSFDLSSPTTLVLGFLVLTGVFTAGWIVGKKF